MTLKQEFEKAYKTWEANEKKLGVTKENYKKLYLGMESLKKDLYSFANRFEKNFIQAEKMTDKMANNIYNDIRDNLVGKIVKAKSFIDVDEKKWEDKEICVPDSLEAIDILKIECNELKLSFENSKNLSDFFEKAMSKLYNSMPTNLLIKYQVANVIRALSIFIFSVFKIMHSKLVIAEKISEKDEKYFYDENDSNFVSKAIRYLFPNYWSARAQEYDKHTIELVKGDVKIFPQGKPLPREVKQAGVGDCYLMAALIALAKKEPQTIIDCFVQGLDKIENEENIDIRFFRIKEHLYVTVPVIITVNKKKVIMPQYIKDGALWPKLIEKAYEIYRKKGYGFFEVKQEKLDGGESRWPMFAITGKMPKILSYTKKDIISKIKSKLEKSKSLTCGFKKKFEITDVKSKEKIQMYNNHAYAIVGIGKADKKRKIEEDYIRLIEPNKVAGRDPKYNNNKNKEGGHIAISFKDFEDNYRDISYTTNKSY